MVRKVGGVYPERRRRAKPADESRETHVHLAEPPNFSRPLASAFFLAWLQRLSCRSR
jgi:hypothetical protein